MTLQVKGRVVRSEAMRHGIKFILDIEGHEVHFGCAIEHPHDNVRLIGQHRLVDIMRGCGRISINDSDELDGCTFDCFIEHDDVRSFVPKPLEATPVKRPGWLRRLGQDWIRAPISGTAIIMSIFAASVSFWRGDIALGLICLTYGEVVAMRRGPFKEDEE